MKKTEQLESNKRIVTKSNSSQTAQSSDQDRNRLLETLPEHKTTRPLRYTAVLQQQQQQGNLIVQRMLATPIQRISEDEQTTPASALDIAESEETMSPQTRNISVSQPELLARYEQLATEKMPIIVAEVLSRQRSTTKRQRLQELFTQFENLRTEIRDNMTRAEHTQAMEILREARILARADFGTLRNSVWRRLRKDPELRELTNEMVQVEDAQLGGKSGSVRVKTSWDDGREKFQALEIEHKTRLSDNPWRYNDPDNLILTDSPQNQQFLEALRREGGIWPSADAIESFILTHGLHDQTAVGPPKAR